jgi:hypothetical protein
MISALNKKNLHTAGLRWGQEGSWHRDPSPQVQGSSTNLKSTKKKEKNKIKIHSTSNTLILLGFSLMLGFNSTLWVLWLQIKLENELKFNSWIPNLLQIEHQMRVQMHPLISTLTNNKSSCRWAEVRPRRALAPRPLTSGSRFTHQIQNSHKTKKLLKKKKLSIQLIRSNLAWIQSHMNMHLHPLISMITNQTWKCT